MLQIRRSEKSCGGFPHTWTHALDSTAFAADYAGAIFLFHYEGASAHWGLNTKDDLRRTMQAYFCGCANDGDEPYVNEVLGYQSTKPWTKPGF